MYLQLSRKTGQTSKRTEPRTYLMHINILNTALKKMSTNIRNYESFTANLGLFRTNVSRLIHKVNAETLMAKWQRAPNTEDQSVLQIRSENKCLNVLSHHIKERITVSF